MTSLDIDFIQENRLQVAEKYSKEWNQILVLKGAFTIIADPSGTVALIPVGYPNEAPAARSRRPLNEIMHKESF